MIDDNVMILKKHTRNVDYRKFILQFARYLVSGGIATLVDIGIYFLASSVIGINHILANTISFVFGLAVNYVIARSWVFDNKASVVRSFVMFSVTGVAGLLLGDLILYLQVDCGIIHRLVSIDNIEIIKLIAKCNSVAVVLIWNFLSRKYFVFN